MSVVNPNNYPSILANAQDQTRMYGLTEFPIVDVDAHHYEENVWSQIAQYVDKPSIKEYMMYPQGVDQFLPSNLGVRRLGRRIKRDPESKFAADDGIPALVHQFAKENAQLGIDYSIIFPTAMLLLGTHPVVELEVAIAKAYCRWLTEQILPHDCGIRSMLYLPFNDPDASLEIVEEFGEKKGVVGFMITSVRYAPVYLNRYMKVFRAIEERGMPVAFHPHTHWQERPFEQLNRFLSVHALGFPFYNMVQLCNLVINGLPERFPKLKWIFMECGISYLIFLMFRLDSEYMMRPSEAPLLKKLPSEYMKEFFYTTQPLEHADKLDDLRWMIEKINGETQLLYSSDWPHWDFDPPGRIYTLPFLSEQAKRNILGGNAMRLLKL